MEREFEEAFEVWFKQGGCDFWSESNAPKELASIAASVAKSLYVPRLRIASEALGVLAHVTQPAHARVAQAALDALQETENGTI